MLGDDPQQCGSSEAVLSLPRAVWSSIAEYLGIRGSVATLQTSVLLCAAFEVPAIWHQHALARGLVIPASGLDAAWICSSEPKVKLHQSVDWKLLLRLNIVYGRGPVVFARVRDFDIRIPLFIDVLGRNDDGWQEMQLLLQMLQYVLIFPSEFKTARCWRWPLRVRWLQWAGRPGLLLKERRVQPGSRLLVEWALPKRGRKEFSWPLPPLDRPVPCHGIADCLCGCTCQANRQIPGEAQPNLRAVGGVCRRTFDPGPVSTAWVSSPQAWDGGPHKEVQTEFMVRLTSSLLLEEAWILIQADATIVDLCEEIAAVLRQSESSLLRRRVPQFRLTEGWLTAGTSFIAGESPTLRQLAWVQSQTVTLELQASETDAASGSHYFACPPARTLSKEPVRNTGHPDGGLVLDFRRDQAFAEVYHPEPRKQSSPWARSKTKGNSPRSRSLDRGVSLPEAPVAYPYAPTPFLRCADDANLLPEPQVEASAEPRRSFTEPVTQRCFSAVDRLAFDADELGRQRTQPSEEEWRHNGLDDSSEPGERIVPHYPPILIPGTQQTRQFEFHPLLPNVMLVGDKEGGANIVDFTPLVDDVCGQQCHCQNCNGSRDCRLGNPLKVDVCPLLGLAWLKRNPCMAICGASNSGAITLLRYNPSARSGEPALEKADSLPEFQSLSSLSVNCSDNFLLASGISSNIALYDIETGKEFIRGVGVHQHFINISRFCHSSPNIFATASFDHTCKIWDLRQPLTRDRPVKTLNTGGHNVMCGFSPDDRFFLCSGVDTHVVQFEVPSWTQTPVNMPLRAPLHQERYRRSAYLANGTHFVTAATEESHMHLLSIKGKKLGVIDFRGVLKEWTKTWYRPVHERAKDICSSWPPALVRGKIHLDDADLDGGSTRKNHEFIQSIRTDPVLAHRIGVLMSESKPNQRFAESCIALLHLDKREVDGESGR